MVELKNRVVVVTGATGGIGKCLALGLAKRGAIVVIAARSVKNLEKLKSLIKPYNNKIFPIFLALTSRNSIKSMVDKVIKKYNRIDILINGAGIGLFANIAKSNWSDIKKLFETNFFGPLLCIQLVSSHMRKRKNGLIVNISSAISKHSLYHQGIYSASKAALERITEAFNIEEHKNGIRTLLVIPDRTKTKFRDHVLGKRKFAKLPFKLPESRPDYVANKIIESILKDKSLCYTSLRGRTYSAVSGISPVLINRLYKKSYYNFIKKLK